VLSFVDKAKQKKKIHWNYEFIGIFYSSSKKAKSGALNAKNRLLAGLGGRKHSIYDRF
jgi:hypothetical protein